MVLLSSHDARRGSPYQAMGLGWPPAQSKGQKPDSTDPHAPCTFSFHTSFDDASTPPDAPARWSIEVRCVVMYR